MITFEVVLVLCFEIQGKLKSLLLQNIVQNPSICNLFFISV